MRILDRYIGRTVAGSTFTVLFALIGIFAFFQFLDELDSIGRGRYSVFRVIEYVFFSIPGLAYEMLPVAALVGSLVGLGALMKNSEIIVVRAAGVPLSRIIYAVLKAGLLVVFMAVIIGEFIAPPSEAFANNRRSLAINDQIALKTKHGFWARDGRSYINIRRILPGDRVEDIYIYEFDDDKNLKASTYAESAQYTGKQWILESIEQTLVSDKKVEKRVVSKAAWDSLLRPDLINLVVVEPGGLSMWDLVKTIRYMKRNDQSSLRYEQALWSKICYPLAAGVMVLLAVPIVLRSARDVTVGQRVILGALIGMAFHIVNQGAGEMGLVYNLPPMLSVPAPTLITLGIAIYLTRRLA